MTEVTRSEERQGGNTALPPPLEVVQISKSFAAVQALSKVSLEFRAGEVLALLGENGAGKSTLLRVLGGAHRPDSGRMLRNGKEISFASPRDAHQAGVRVIAQEPELGESLTVAENVFLGDLPKRFGFVSSRALIAATAVELARLGVEADIRPQQLVSTLSPAHRQTLEILKALRANAEIVAFDEPTSSLTVGEVERLLDILSRLRSSGTAVIYVSHRIKEILRIADRVAVLRDGELVALRATAYVDEAELVRLMVGRTIAGFKRTPAPRGEPVLKVRGLSSSRVSGVDLTVDAGEVVGLAGLVGAGRTELAHAIFGLDTFEGNLTIAGVEISSGSPREAIRAGAALVPEERKAQALMLNRSVRENIALASLDSRRRLRFVRKRTEKHLADELIQRLSIKTPTSETLVTNLSGGNQQKVVLARWLARNPKLLILDEPTRGVDVGAKAEIYALISELAIAGVAILLISSELPELLLVSDRIVVMRNGRIVGHLDHAEATEQAVTRLAFGEQLAAAARPTRTVGKEQS